MKSNTYNFKDASAEELIGFYSEWVEELRNRNIIRTKNIVGEIGEFLAIQYYKNTPGLPKLQATATSTKSIDAISNKGERYSIKTVSSKTTSAFYGVTEESNKLFEYVIIVVMNQDYTVNKILEITWDSFWKHKHWNSRMATWNLSITKKLIKDSKIRYDKQETSK